MEMIWNRVKRLQRENADLTSARAELQDTIARMQLEINTLRSNGASAAVIHDKEQQLREAMAVYGETSWRRANGAAWHSSAGGPGRPATVPLSGGPTPSTRAT